MASKIFYNHGSSAVQTESVSLDIFLIATVNGYLVAEEEYVTTENVLSN